MSVYRTRVPLPGTTASVVQAIHGVAHIVEIHDDAFIVHIEADDEYSLAETVRDLQGEVSANGGEGVTIPRPTLVESTPEERRSEPAPGVYSEEQGDIEDARLVAAREILAMDNPRAGLDTNDAVSILQGVVDYADERLRINKGLMHVNRTLQKRIDEGAGQ